MKAYLSSSCCVLSSIPRGGLGCQREVLVDCWVGDKICKAFGEADDTKNAANTGGWTPAKTGDKTEAREGLEGKKAMGKQVTWISKRESYLSSLCIVFS